MHPRCVMYVTKKNNPTTKSPLQHCARNSSPLTAAKKAKRKRIHLLLLRRIHFCRKPNCLPFHQLRPHKPKTVWERCCNYSSAYCEAEWRPLPCSQQSRKQEGTGCIKEILEKGKGHETRVLYWRNSLLRLLLEVIRQRLFK